MTTVIIDTKTEEAKKMVELLKSTKYAKIIDAQLSNKETLKAIDDGEKGNLKSYSSYKKKTHLVKL